MGMAVGFAFGLVGLGFAAAVLLLASAMIATGRLLAGPAPQPSQARTEPELRRGGNVVPFRARENTKPLLETIPVERRRELRDGWEEPDDVA